MCDDSTKEKTNGTRLRRLLLDGGTRVLRDFFDSIHPNSALHSVLKTHEVGLKKKCRFDDQIQLLFPANGKPDSKTFDITLLVLLLSNICSLKAPSTGWKKEPSPSDQSKEANIVRIKLFRNKIQHHSGSGIKDDQFEILWSELATSLKALGLPENEIDNLKVNPIDDNSEIQERFQKLCDHEQRIESLEKQVNEQGAQIKEIKEELQIRKKQTLESCIPDKPPSFIGRQKELNEILSAKMDENTAFVLVHGMAGVGKSTLVKKASWDLVKEHNKTVYFVDLCHCKATEEEISKTINYELHHGTKVENKPREALNIWARNVDQNVTLVLDNAEYALSSQPQTGNDSKGQTDMSCFVKILLEIRMFSNHKVDFLIASREEVLSFDVDVTKKEIPLKPFEETESLQFIDFLSNECTNDDELTNNHKQAIAKLCSNIPLALHIVIPLLNDYTPEELIENLKSKPMEDILEPLKRTVSLSFENFDDILRDHLAKLTIFPESFAADSAMAVIGVSKKNAAIEVLKKLSKKSLLQKENRKYSLHPFIHEFVVDYGKMKDKQHLIEEGKFNFLNHFLSLLLQNMKLYWDKDCCQQSLSAFFKGRVNFEKALEISLLLPRMENTTEKLLKELPNIVMYLESCISWDLLERLLDNFIKLASENNLPSRELEALCWKGHIVRRGGDEEEYEKLVEEAHRVYNCNSAQAKNSGVQIDDRAKICYKSAKGRYLSHKGNNDQGVKTFEEIIEFCNEERRDKDPSLNEDYARAIVELGHNLKKKKQYKMAVEKFKQASDIYEKHLGEHIKTALSYKDIADGYLIQDQETQVDEEQALEYYDKAKKMYEKAIDMLTALKSDSETHMILLLKNTGICYRKMKRYQDSERQFKKALTIAEKKLKENHRYKCWVNEELAYLCDDVGEKEKAKAFAEKASEMAKTLNLRSGHWLEDKERLLKILSY